MLPGYTNNCNKESRTYVLKGLQINYCHYNIKI